MEAKEEGGKTGNGRAEIDTRPPIRSVKDAVSKYGEGVFSVDKQAIRRGGPVIKSITMELKETKETLEKAREETEQMVTKMSSLEQELDNTKKELQKLKELRGSEMLTFDFEGDEDLKFVKESPLSDDDDEGETEFQKKRYVTFAHPTLSQIILPDPNPNPAMLKRNPSLKKDKDKKKKSFTLLPLFGGIFPKRKTKCDV